MAGCLLTGSLCATSPTQAQVIRSQVTLSEPQQRDLDLLVSVARESRLGSEQRREAVAALLDRNWPEAIDAVAAMLNLHDDPSTQQVVVQTLMRRRAHPPIALLNPLLDLLGPASDSYRHDLAVVLGRFEDQAVARMLARIAREAPNDVPARQVGAILALGHHRYPFAAAALLEAIEPGNPPAVQEAGFQALAELTGIHHRSGDAKWWQQWWHRHQDLSETQWLSMLLHHHARLGHELRQENQDQQNRLLESQRQLYRAASDESRPALLINMLNDPLAAMRTMAVQLADQRFVTAARVPEPELRAALRGRIHDPDPQIRKQAVRLLREIKDEDAADQVALRLVAGQEHDPQVISAYLSLMTRLPRAVVVDHVISLLDSPFAIDAAGVLTAAADQDLLSGPQQSAIANWLGEHLARQPQPIAGSFVSLLGRVGDDSSWARIRRWLHSEDASVRRAAAEVWANSNQPLHVLAELAQDPLIQPILIDAAARRGNDRQTLLTLIAAPPQQEQLVQAWRRSLVAMAKRTTADDVLAADQILADQSASLTLRDQLLTAGIDQIEPGHDAVDLLLARAAVRLAMGDVNQALADLGTLAGDEARLSDQQRGPLLAMLTHARLSSGNLEAAGAAAAEWFQLHRRLSPQEQWVPQAEPLLALFATAIQRSLGNQPQQAQQLLDLLRQAVGEPVPGPIQQRLHELGEQLDAALTEQPMTTGD